MSEITMNSSHSKKYAQTNKTECAACGACIRECPRNAIEIWKGCYAIINADICVGCGKCALICPAGCIEVLARKAENE